MHGQRLSKVVGCGPVFLLKAESCRIYLRFVSDAWVSGYMAYGVSKGVHIKFWGLGSFQ